MITEGVEQNRPVMPVALSTNAVTELVPMSAPILTEKASTQYAMVEFSKSNVTGSRSPANFAMEYRVLQGLQVSAWISYSELYCLLTQWCLSMIAEMGEKVNR